MSTSNGRMVRSIWSVEVKPGKMGELLNTIAEKGPLAERVWGSRSQILRTTVGGALSGTVVFVTDFQNMAGFGDCFDRAQNDEEWLEFLAWFNGPDSPAITQSIMLMTDITPGS